MMKGQGLSESRAASLGIRSAAEAVGVPWSDGVFPQVINVRDAKVAELRDAFLGWPLPAKPCTSVSRQSLTGRAEADLVDVWHRVARRNSITNPDKLPHTQLLSEIRTEFASQSQLEMSSGDVFQALISLRKSGNLPPVK